MAMGVKKPTSLIEAGLFFELIPGGLLTPDIRSAGMPVALPVMLVMTVPVSVIMVMSVPFKINPVSSFNVIGTACVNLNKYSRGRRHIATDADIHAWRARHHQCLIQEGET